MHATLMAIKPPTPPAEDFLIEVQCQDGEEEPSYARVVAAVRKMCKKSDDAPIAIAAASARGGVGGAASGWSLSAIGAYRRHAEFVERPTAMELQNVIRAALDRGFG